MSSRLRWLRLRYVPEKLPAEDSTYSLPNRRSRGVPHSVTAIKPLYMVYYLGNALNDRSRCAMKGCGRSRKVAGIKSRKSDRPPPNYWSSSERREFLTVSYAKQSAPTTRLLGFRGNEERRRHNQFQARHQLGPWTLRAAWTKTRRIVLSRSL